MISMLVAWLLALAGIGISYPIVRYLDSHRQLTLIESTGASYLVGCLISFLLIWGIGVFELSIATMVPLGIVLLIWSLPGNKRFVNHITLEYRNYTHPKNLFFKVVFVAVTLLILGLVIGAFSPPGDGDAVRYHLLQPKRDIELGRIHAILGWGIYDFFPSAIENLYRFSMVLSDMRSAQHIHVLFALVTAGFTWAIARRIGMSETVSMVAVGLFLSIRLVMYQPATADIDLGLTAATAALLALLLVWRDLPTYRLMVLAGLMAGLILNIKYNGIVIFGTSGLILTWYVFRKRISAFHLIIFSAVAIILFSPLMLKNYMITGNPIFPLFNDLFGENRIDPLKGTIEFYAKGRGFVDFIFAPLTIFLAPVMFDGHQLGGVILLAFLPFCRFRNKENSGAGLALTFLLIFFSIWFWKMAQMVRFLQPVYPILAVFAAQGASEMWRIVRPFKFIRPMVIVICLVLVGTQAMFFVGTSIRRWPVAFGVKSEQSYLFSPPYIMNTHIKACEYLQNNLKTDEVYLSLLHNPSVYCPQKSMFLQIIDTDLERIYTKTPFRPVSLNEFINLIRKNKIQYVISNLQLPDLTISADNKNYNSVVRDLNNRRFLDILHPVLTQLEPVLITKTAKVYDTASIVNYMQ